MSTTITRVITFIPQRTRSPVLITQGRTIRASTKPQRIVTLSKEGARGPKGDAGLSETEINQQIDNYDVGDLSALFLSS